MWTQNILNTELRLKPSPVNTKFHDLKPRLSCKWCSLNVYHLHQIFLYTKENITKKIKYIRCMEYLIWSKLPNVSCLGAKSGWLLVLARNWLIPWVSLPSASSVLFHFLHNNVQTQTIQKNDLWGTSHKQIHISPYFPCLYPNTIIVKTNFW